MLYKVKDGGEGLPNTELKKQRQAVLYMLYKAKEVENFPNYGSVKKV